MELEEWWKSDSAKNCWAQGFRNSPTPGDDLFVCKFLKCSRQHRKSLWAEYHEPYEGIRLIAFELDPSVYPPRVECRVWIYDGQDDLWAKFSQREAPTLLDNQSVRWVDVLPGRSWKRQLQESNTLVKGVQYDAKHPILSTTPAFSDQLTVESKLEETVGLLAEQFLAWVDKVYRGQIVSEANHPETAEAIALVEDTSSFPASRGDEEGEWQQVIVTQYERSRSNRKACLDHYGPACQACGMSFGDVYGELGTGFIHVHHEVPLHTLGGPQNVDPVKDMKPLCPNCHAMVHRADPPIPVIELREQLVRDR
ncbi:HNH endonuclease [Pseudomonas syringae pv. syringae]|uniref:HNH endonuclease n=1 Tax=Pseudomonas syringae TaxID=317 RepID=UPI003B00F35A